MLSSEQLEELKVIKDKFEENKSTHNEIVGQVKKYRYYYDNKVGRVEKSRIIRNLRLVGEVSNWINTDGKILEKQFINNTYQYSPTGLDVLDILVETTLPKTAVETLRTYSVGELPVADIDSENDEQINWAREFEKNVLLHEKIGDLVIELCVTGNAFFKNELDMDGQVKWINLPIENVLIIPSDYDVNEPGYFVYFCLDNKTQEVNYIEIFKSNGEIYIIRDLEKLDSENNEVIENGLNTFNIKFIKGLQRNEINTLYGGSIYQGLESVFREIVERKTSNSYIFNKFANPNLITSKELSELNEQGQKVVYTGKVYNLGDPEDAAATKYLESPTGHLANTYPHFDQNLKEAYAQLGVNETALGLGDMGGVASGEAFKKAITPTLNKCRDINNRLYIPLIMGYRHAYQLETGEDSLKLDIKFADGIAPSDKETAETNAILVNNELQSRETILIKQGYNQKEALDEIQRIAEEKALMTLTAGEIDEENINPIEPQVPTIEPENDK